MIVYTMVRDGAPAAQVVTLDSGKCIVSWPTSTIVYDSEDAARDVHIDHMGARGAHTAFSYVWSSHPDIARGMDDCTQDAYENCPFSSIGGLEKRGDMQVPSYTNAILDPAAYLLGYRTQARVMHGRDWKTCEFSWRHALTLHPDGSVTGPEKD